MLEAEFLGQVDPPLKSGQLGPTFGCPSPFGTLFTVSRTPFLPSPLQAHRQPEAAFHLAHGASSKRNGPGVARRGRGKGSCCYREPSILVGVIEIRSPGCRPWSPAVGW